MLTSQPGARPPRSPRRGRPPRSRSAGSPAAGRARGRVTRPGPGRSRTPPRQLARPILAEHLAERQELAERDQIHLVVAGAQHVRCRRARTGCCSRSAGRRSTSYRSPPTSRHPRRGHLGSGSCAPPARARCRTGTALSARSPLRRRVVWPPDELQMAGEPGHALVRDPICGAARRWPARCAAAPSVSASGPAAVQAPCPGGEHEQGEHRPAPRRRRRGPALPGRNQGRAQPRRGHRQQAQAIGAEVGHACSVASLAAQTTATGFQGNWRPSRPHLLGHGPATAKASACASTRRQRRRATAAASPP